MEPTFIKFLNAEIFGKVYAVLYVNLSDIVDIKRARLIDQLVQVYVRDWDYPITVKGMQASKFISWLEASPDRVIQL